MVIQAHNINVMGIFLYLAAIHLSVGVLASGLLTFVPKKAKRLEQFTKYCLMTGLTTLLAAGVLNTYERYILAIDLTIQWV